YLAFTGIAKGNVSLSTSVLPINLILQVVFLPIYLLLFSGTIDTIPISMLIESILIILFILFSLSYFTIFFFRYKDIFFNYMIFFYIHHIHYQLTRLLLRITLFVLHNKIIPFFSNAQIFFLSLSLLPCFLLNVPTYLKT